jgi:hypothetical protein
MGRSRPEKKAVERRAGRKWAMDWWTILDLNQ